MSSIKENEMQKFPDVPDCVHQAVLDALKKVETISEQEKEIAPKRGRHLSLIHISEPTRR